MTKLFSIIIIKLKINSFIISIYHFLDFLLFFFLPPAYDLAPPVLGLGLLACLSSFAIAFLAYWAADVADFVGIL